MPHRTPLPLVAGGMADRAPAYPRGTVPIPNRLFDDVLPNLTDTQLRVLLVVLRATIGWREGEEGGGWRYKRRDWISHAQFARRTGRGSEAISTAIQSLVEASLIVAEDSGGRPLDTPEKRRRYVGRLYFRPVDMWITPDRRHTGKAKTTTYIRNNKYNVRTSGWHRAANISPNEPDSVPKAITRPNPAHKGIIKH